jgi:hypothetical protein
LNLHLKPFLYGIIKNDLLEKCENKKFVNPKLCEKCTDPDSRFEEEPGQFGDESYPFSPTATMDERSLE